jgi:hypothetical protein
MNITSFNNINENKHKTTYERRNLHDWRGCELQMSGSQNLVD